MFIPQSDIEELEKVKAGDNIYIFWPSLRGEARMFLDKVSRTTPKQIVTVKDYRFWKKTGLEVTSGSSYQRHCAAPQTYKYDTMFLGWQIRRAQQERKQKAIQYLRKADWQSVNVNVLEQIVELLEVE